MTYALDTFRGELARLINAVRGNAAVEFAVIAPVLVTLVLGTVDLGMMTREAAALDAAVRAAAEYARSSPCDTSTATGCTLPSWSPDPNIATIVQGYTSFSATVSVSYAKPNTSQTYPFCECPGGTSLTCGGTCTTTPSTPVHYYVAISASETFTPLLPITGLLVSTTLSSTVTTRVQ